MRVLVSWNVSAVKAIKWDKVLPRAQGWLPPPQDPRGVCHPSEGALSIHMEQGTPSYSGLPIPHASPNAAVKQHPRKWSISAAIFLLSRSALWAIKTALAVGGDPMANEIQMWPNQPSSKRAARPHRHLSPLLRRGTAQAWGWLGGVWAK